MSGPMELELSQASDLMAVKQDPSVTDFFSQLSAIQLQTKTLKVRNDTEEITASECLAQIGTLGKAVEAKRKAVVDPPNRFVTAVNGFFKTITNPLVSAKLTIEQQIMQYRNLKRIEAEKARAKAQAEADKINKRLEKAGLEVTPVQVIAPQVQQTTRTEIGTTFERKEWKHEVTDLLMLCKAVARGDVQVAAIQANDTYLRALVKGGAREIPGVKVYEEVKLQTRSA
jgi:hypothetical protein